MRDVVGLGLCVVDQFFRVDDFGLGEERTRYRESLESDVGGMTANALLQAARLGCRAHLLSWLGDDPDGRFLRRTLRARVSGHAQPAALAPGRDDPGGVPGGAPQRASVASWWPIAVASSDARRASIWGGSVPEVYCSSTPTFPCPGVASREARAPRRAQPVVGDFHRFSPDVQAAAAARRLPHRLPGVRPTRTRTAHTATRTGQRWPGATAELRWSPWASAAASTGVAGRARRFAAAARPGPRHHRRRRRVPRRLRSGAAARSRARGCVAAGRARGGALLQRAGRQHPTARLGGGCRPQGSSVVSRSIAWTGAASPFMRSAIAA